MADDKQIDDLDDLDSLLDELDDEILNKPPGSGAPVEEKIKVPVAEDEEHEDGSLEDQFSSMMKEIQSKDPNLASQLDDFVKELQKDEAKASGKPDTQPINNRNFEDIVSDTINRLKTSGEDVDKQIKEEQSGDPLSQFLKQLGDMKLEDGEGLEDEGEGGLGDVLMDMLSQLTSKNVLYEPLKDLHTKFPGWLSANKSKITEKEFDNYSKQYGIIDEIILKFESENYHEKVDAEFINLKLENLQELGMPPEEIMNSELGGIPGFSKESNNFTNEEIPDDIKKQLDENCNQT